MNISSGSCEYFYDEEYDVAINEGTYNQPLFSSINNNYYPFVNGKQKIGNKFNRDYLTTSRLWSECLLENSNNNNYNESNINLNSSIFKCKSSDNVVDVSEYSISDDIHYIDQTVDNSFNYRIYFEKNDLLDTKGHFDIRKQFAKRYNSKVFIDSGKCSAATSDSLIHPFKHYRNELASSENNLNETSQENRKESYVISHRKKSSRELWQKLKSVFSRKRIKWKKTISDNKPIQFSRSYSVPCFATPYFPSNDQSCKNNRFSTTVVELYNLLTDICSECHDSVFPEKDKYSKYVQTTMVHKHDVDCQTSQFSTGIHLNKKRTGINANMEYPGLGKIKLPHQLRTSIRHLISAESGFTNLKFLENISETRSIGVSRSRSMNGVRGRPSKNNNDGRRKCRMPDRCASEIRQKRDSAENICGKKDAYCNLFNNFTDLVIMEDSKSVSFSDLRPIPRKMGLGTCDDMMSIFEVQNRAVATAKPMGYDEENSDRIGGLVTNAINALKTVSTAVSSTQDLVTLCDRFMRSRETNRNSTPALLLAVDAVVTLVSDGLFLDSVRGHNVVPDALLASKIIVRMWMFIEESCRSSLLKDPSQKLAFGNLLKQVKQVSGTVRPKDSCSPSAQLKLHMFIVMAIKTNILHVWLRSIVANDTILHRFFSPCSFLQQARTSYSNALSAVVVELRRLSSVGSSKVVCNIGKPVKGKARPPAVPRQVSNSSSDNSTSKSKIPRLSNKKLSK